MIKVSKKTSLITSLIALAVVLSPAVAGAAASNTTVTATVASAITISSGPTVGLSLTPTASGVVSSLNDSVIVNTNNAAGYTLTFSDSDTNSTLVDGSNSFTAHAGTQASPSALANGTWGYAVPGVGGFAGSYAQETNATASATLWAGVPSSASPNTLKTTATTAVNDTTAVWFAAKANTVQPPGTYTGQVTYTATTN